MKPDQKIKMVALNCDVPEPYLMALIKVASDRRLKTGKLITRYKLIMDSSIKGDKDIAREYRNFLGNPPTEKG